MAVPIVVPDASVILKWLLPSQDELDLERAIALREAIMAGDVHARVPTLWLYEVGNTLIAGTQSGPSACWSFSYGLISSALHERRDG